MRGKTKKRKRIRRWNGSKGTDPETGTAEADKRKQEKERQIKKYIVEPSKNSFTTLIYYNIFYNFVFLPLMPPSSGAVKK